MAPKKKKGGAKKEKKVVTCGWIYVWYGTCVCACVSVCSCEMYLEWVTEKKPAPDIEPFVYEPVTFPSMEWSGWVTVHIKLVTWDYLNFSERLNTDTRLFALKQLIVSKQGGAVDDLVLYKDVVHPHNQLTDDLATLGSLEIIGDISRDRGDSECVFYYDFKPKDSLCPLLLCDPRVLVGDTDKKLVRPLSAPSRVSSTPLPRDDNATGRPPSARPGLARQLSRKSGSGHPALVNGRPQSAY
eukprot:GFYU01016448.1.p1 GENE.GFYU01016448.1~~GFYU01016448.1.p1  ORF type:complete len:242 (-),score=44.82 GFYU01016448.1:319-1044(-)